jgi:hypothetical protein
MWYVDAFADHLSGFFLVGSEKTNFLQQAAQTCRVGQLYIWTVLGFAGTSSFQLRLFLFEKVDAQFLRPALELSDQFFLGFLWTSGILTMNALFAWP